MHTFVPTEIKAQVYKYMCAKMFILALYLMLEKSKLI